MLQIVWERERAARRARYLQLVSGGFVMFAIISRCIAIYSTDEHVQIQICCTWERIFCVSIFCERYLLAGPEIRSIPRMRISYNAGQMPSNFQIATPLSIQTVDKITFACKFEVIVISFAKQAWFPFAMRFSQFITIQLLCKSVSFVITASFFVLFNFSVRLLKFKPDVMHSHNGWRRSKKTPTNLFNQVSFFSKFFFYFHSNRSDTHFNDCVQNLLLHLYEYKMLCIISNRTFENASNARLGVKAKWSEGKRKCGTVK